MFPLGWIRPRAACSAPMRLRRFRRPTTPDRPYWTGAATFLGLAGISRGMAAQNKGGGAENMSNKNVQGGSDGHKMSDMLSGRGVYLLLAICLVVYDLVGGKRFFFTGDDPRSSRPRIPIGLPYPRGGGVARSQPTPPSPEAPSRRRPRRLLRARQVYRGLGAAARAAGLTLYLTRRG